MGLGLPNGWLIGGLCWLVLRLLGRLDNLEREQAETRRTVDEIHREFKAFKEKAV